MLTSEVRDFGKVYIKDNQARDLITQRVQWPALSQEYNKWEAIWSMHYNKSKILILAVRLCITAGGVNHPLGSNIARNDLPLGGESGSQLKINSKQFKNRSSRVVICLCSKICSKIARVCGLSYQNICASEMYTFLAMVLFCKMFLNSKCTVKWCLRKSFGRN